MGGLTQGALVSMSMQVVRLDPERREEEKSPGSSLGAHPGQPPQLVPWRLARQAGSCSQSTDQQLVWLDSRLGQLVRVGVGDSDFGCARG